MHLAFIALLQHLPGRQRAALVLRDVLGFSAADAAQVWGSASRRSTVPFNEPGQRRANACLQAVSTMPMGRTDSSAVRPGVGARRRQRHPDHAESDARYSMPPLPQWFAGHEDIRGFLLDGPIHLRWRFVIGRANEQVAFGTYAWDDEHGTYRAFALDLVGIHGGLVTEVVSFLSPEIFGRFGLPDEIS